MSGSKLGRNPFQAGSKATPTTRGPAKRKAAPARLKARKGRATRGLCPLGTQAVRWAAEVVSVGVKGALLAREAVIATFSR